MAIAGILKGYRPVRLLPLSFLAVIIIGSFLLMLPGMSADGVIRPLASAFTATSAVCVTGLTVVDTATYWTPLGQAVILVLAQLGGFGIMSLATLLSLLARGHLDLTSTVLVKESTKASSLGSATRLLRNVAMSMLVAESLVGVVLTLRFYFAYGDGWPRAVWRGVYHAVMSFTNAGFSLQSDSMTGFISDAWIIWPMALCVLAGSLGFPVFFELVAQWRRPARWSVHTHLTVLGFAILGVLGFVLYLAFEWNNPGTLGPLDNASKVNGAVFGTVMPRSGGFNAVDYGEIRSETLVTTVILMFIGGGSAGTSGGLKVTTFFLLAFVVLAEVRGQRDVTIARRRIPEDTQRMALSVAILSSGAVVVGTVTMVLLTDVPLDTLLFDVVSAFGTVGLSTGITGDLPASGQITLMMLMYLGRVGTVTAVSALALRPLDNRYRLPEERPIVG